MELLIEKGLDVNRSGPSGNALEYLWQIANKDPIDWHNSAICHLINLGAVNFRQDPNGLVPSVNEMREFAIWKGDRSDKYPTILHLEFRWDKHNVWQKEVDAWRKERARYYAEGPLDTASH